MHPSLDLMSPVLTLIGLRDVSFGSRTISVLHRQALARHGASGKNDKTDRSSMASRPPASRWPGQAGWNRILYLTCPRCSPSSRILLFAFQPRRTSAIYVSENDARDEFGPVCAECESPVQAHNKPTDIVSKGLAHCADDVGIHHVGSVVSSEWPRQKRSPRDTAKRPGQRYHDFCDSSSASGACGC